MAARLARFRFRVTVAVRVGLCCNKVLNKQFEVGRITSVVLLKFIIGRARLGRGRPTGNRYLLMRRILAIAIL